MNRSTRRHECASDSVFAGPAFSTRQITAIVVAILLGLVLYPVGAKAAALLNVVITDPGGASKAHVDASGHLQVGGTVGIDSSTPVSTTTADDPGRQAFGLSPTVFFDPSSTVAFYRFSVPEGKRLVIEFASEYARLPVGQRLVTARIFVHLNGGIAFYDLTPVFVGTDVLDEDVSVASHDVTIYADGGAEVTLQGERSTSGGGGVLFVSASGHLIDCTVATCN
jgi:hypothetical protein